MVDYSAVVDGSKKLQNAIYQFVLGIRGRRKNPVSYNQITKWFHGTPELFVTTNLNALVGHNTHVVNENGKYRVKTFRDHVNDREMRREIRNEMASVRRFGRPD